MATLYLLVGLPGSGKTTLAGQIERERGALVLSTDDWMSRIVRDGWDAERRAMVQEVQFEIALKVLRIGGDVVLDFGLFHRHERDQYRARATASGAETKSLTQKGSGPEVCVVIHHVDVNRAGDSACGRRNIGQSIARLGGVSPAT